MSDAAEVVIAIGSNLGDRAQAIRSALDAFDGHPAITGLRSSRAHETAPVGPVGQGPYLNAVACFRTTLGPRDVLGLCLDIERRAGRDRRDAVRWGPRILDLDVLLYGDRVIDEAGLAVPHPRMHERTFVLEPLVEVKPDAWHPILAVTARELLRRLTASTSPDRETRNP